MGGLRREIVVEAEAPARAGDRESIIAIITNKRIGGHHAYIGAPKHTSSQAKASC